MCRAMKWVPGLFSLQFSAKTSPSLKISSRNGYRSSHERKYRFGPMLLRLLTGDGSERRTLPTVPSRNEDCSGLIEGGREYPMIDCLDGALLATWFPIA